jgi:hypothetical protein
MSNNTGSNHQQDQGQQNNNGILNNLLAIATDAQGNRPLDPNVSEMSIEVIISCNSKSFHLKFNRIEYGWRML